MIKKHSIVTASSVYDLGIVAFQYHAQSILGLDESLLTVKAIVLTSVENMWNTIVGAQMIVKKEQHYNSCFVSPFLFSLNWNVVDVEIVCKYFEFGSLR